MGDLDEEIKELHRKTARTRHQFLHAELKTCFTALGMAEYELSIGNAAFAGKEVDVIEAGIRTLSRFLPEAAEQQGRELETAVAELKTKLAGIKARLHRQS